LKGGRGARCLKGGRGARCRLANTCQVMPERRRYTQSATWRFLLRIYRNRNRKAWAGGRGRGWDWRSARGAGGSGRSRSTEPALTWKATSRALLRRAISSPCSLCATALTLPTQFACGKHGAPHTGATAEAAGVCMCRLHTLDVWMGYVCVDSMRCVEWTHTYPVL
jgi:hypothetical protein